MSESVKLTRFNDDNPFMLGLVITTITLLMIQYAYVTPLQYPPPVEPHLGLSHWFQSQTCSHTDDNFLDFTLETARYRIYRGDATWTTYFHVASKIELAHEKDSPEMHAKITQFKAVLMSLGFQPSHPVPSTHKLFAFAEELPVIWTDKPNMHDVVSLAVFGVIFVWLLMEGREVAMLVLLKLVFAQYGCDPYVDASVKLAWVLFVVRRLAVCVAWLVPSQTTLGSRFYQEACTMKTKRAFMHELVVGSAIIGEVTTLRELGYIQFSVPHALLSSCSFLTMWCVIVHMYRFVNAVWGRDAFFTSLDMLGILLFLSPYPRDFLFVSDMALQTLPCIVMVLIQPHCRGYAAVYLTLSQLHLLVPMCVYLHLKPDLMGRFMLSVSMSPGDTYEECTLETEAAVASNDTEGMHATMYSRVSDGVARWAMARLRIVLQFWIMEEDEPRPQICVATPPEPPSPVKRTKREEALPEPTPARVPAFTSIALPKPVVHTHVLGACMTCEKPVSWDERDPPHDTSSDKGYYTITHDETTHYIHHGKCARKIALQRQCCDTWIERTCYYRGRTMTHLVFFKE